MVVIHVGEIGLNCQHVTSKNVRIWMIDGIPNVKIMAIALDYHFFPKPFLAVNQINASYIVRYQIRYPSIQTLLFHPVRTNKKKMTGIYDLTFDSGTPCSYEDPHLFCIKGKCKRVGCDHRIGSVKSFNNCGICGGSERNRDYVRLRKTITSRFYVSNSKLKKFY